MRRFGLHVLILMLVASCFEATYARPAQAQAQLRAIACCQRNCPMQGAKRLPERCCGVAPLSDSVPNPSPKLASSPTQAIATLPMIARLDAPIQVSSLIETPLCKSRGKPIFLLKSTLLL